MEASDDDAVFRLKLCFDGVFAISHNRPAPERQIDDVLQTPTNCPFRAGTPRQDRAARDRLLTFCGFADEVDSQTTAANAFLPPAATHREVTNGFRAK
jgi:hypothetical protein